MVQVKLD